MGVTTLCGSESKPDITATVAVSLRAATNVIGPLDVLEMASRVLDWKLFISKPGYLGRVVGGAADIVAKREERLIRYMCSDVTGPA